MPYGTIAHDTRAWVELRAAQSNVADRITLEDVPEGDETEHTVSVIVDGALDEEFSVSGGYEVNVADWIAEFLADTCDTAFWEVLVSTPSCDGVGGDTVYRVSGYES